MLARLMDLTDRGSRYLAIAGGWPVLLLSVMIGVDVVGRKLMNLSVQGSDEVGGYVMAVCCAFGFAYGLTKRSHIRLNLVLPYMPKGFQTLANAVAHVVLALFGYMMLWQMVDMMLDSLRLHAVAPTPLQTPLAIPQALCALGMAYFAFQITLYLVRGCALLLAGKMAEFNRLFGVETAQKEAEAELQETQVVVR